MSLPTSAASYPDCFTFLEAALADPIGARRRMDDYSAANYFRMRCHQARKIDRIDNAATYDATHPMHGRSYFDKLMITIANDSGTFWVYAKKMEIADGDLESLSGQPQLEASKPQLALPAPEPIDELASSVVDTELVELVYKPVTLIRRL